MNTDASHNSPTPRLDRRWLGVACVVGLFMLAVGVVMIRQHALLHATGPVDSLELKALRERLVDEPLDEPLKEQIRLTDRRLRETFLQRQRTLSTGAYLLLFGGIVGVLALKRHAHLHKRAVTPGTVALNAIDQPLQRDRARWAVVVMSGAVLITGVVVIASMSSPLSSAQLSALSVAHQRPIATTRTQATPDARQWLVNWPNFRGPGGLGVVPLEAQGNPAYPTAWDGGSQTNVRWRAEVPLGGFNSPVVWGGRVFLSGATEHEREVYCYNAADGVLLWRRKVDPLRRPGLEEPDVMEETSYAASTVAVDGRRVYAIFPNGDLAAFDFEGHELWAKNLGTPDNHYGHAASLIAFGDTLIVPFDQGYDDDDLSYLAAFDGAKGEQVWKTPRATSMSWASPIIVDTPAGKQLVVMADPLLAAYAPDTGEQLWRCRGIEGELGPSPTFSGGYVFAVLPDAELLAVRADGSDDVTDTHTAWASDAGAPDIVSPLADDERVYQLTTDGLLTAVRIADGELVWEHEFDDHDFMASPTLVGEAIYLFTTKGRAFIIIAGDEFVLTAECDLGEPVHASPAFVGGRIYVRGDRHLFCIEQPEP